MARVTARVSKELAAPPDRVLAVLRDYRTARKSLLTDNWSAYRVEAGGRGSGTVVAYHFSAGGRERDYRLKVLESGGTLREQDELSSFTSVWTVTGSGAGSTVSVEVSWDGASGIAGLFEGFFAPLGLKRIYGEMLNRLAAAVA